MTETFSPILPTDLEERTARLLTQCCDRGITLSTAESCTGGLLSSLLTDVNGASHAFLCGFATYTDEIKAKILGVPADMLAELGAVSQPVAIAMAEGGMARSGADICLSVTGFAGPGGEDDEAGLVHFGCAREGRATLHRECHFGDIGRGPTRIECLRTAIDMLEEVLR